MTSAAEKQNKALELVIEGYNRLKKLDPNHKLLSYICKVDEIGFELSKDKKIWSEFMDMYGPEETPSMVDVLPRYCVDLANAIKELEAKQQ